VQIFFLFVLIGFAVAAFAGVPLAWDGAFYLFASLDAQIPFIPHGRLINVALELPVVAASHLTQNFTLLRLVFCLSYASAPVAGLAASWLVCRERRPSLFVWPALSCCLAMLPGRFAFSGEATMSAWLLWPVFLSALIGVRRTLLPVVALMALAGFLAHPITAEFFALSAAAAAIAAFTSPAQRRRRLYGALALGLIALARTLMPLSDYEKARLSIPIVVGAFRVALLGLPLVALALSFVAAACLLNSARNRTETSRASKSDYVAIAAIVAAGIVLIPWALNAHRWAWQLAYRFFTVPITTAFMIAAAVEVLYLAVPRPDSESPSQNARLLILPFIGGVFLIVLSLQSIVWLRLTGRLERTLSVAPAGCIPRVALLWARRTPLDHWSVAPYAIDIQGRKPKTLVLDRCREFVATGEARLSRQLLRSRHGGWFDLEDIPATIISLRQLKPEEWAAP
jgi:hypothetical protein